MKPENMTLCFPDSEKSCFSCCPPIRPAGFEHFQYRNIIKRILRENTEAFSRDRESSIPITGFSCWALGYVDRNHRRIGCLLHPAHHGGVDLRYRTDYGEKCEREFCPEARVFSGLALEEKRFWLHLADGLDSFSYSSRKLNPLFEMMNWGGHLLRLLATNEDYRDLTKESFFQSYPFFSAKNPPKPNVYLIRWLVDREGTHLLKSHTFKSEFDLFSGRTTKELRHAAQQSNPPQPPLRGRFQPVGLTGRRVGSEPQAVMKGGRREIFVESYTHLLDLDRDFLDFLRLSARITKTSREDALALKKLVDGKLEEFRLSIGRI
jgi:hypothetical protein